MNLIIRVRHTHGVMMSGRQLSAIPSVAIGLAALVFTLVCATGLADDTASTRGEENQKPVIEKKRAGKPVAGSARTIR